MKEPFMKSKVLGLRVAATIFGLVCAVQLVRLFFRVEIIAGGFKIPFWPSAIASLLAGGMCFWLWWLSLRDDK
jgi:hypothetical protein